MPGLTTTKDPAPFLAPKASFAVMRVIKIAQLRFGLQNLHSCNIEVGRIP
jgi:hypothetical protein